MTEHTWKGAGSSEPGRTAMSAYGAAAVTEPFGDQLFDCEYRVYGSDMAYLCLCGSRDEHPDLESFMDCCRKKEPVYDKENRCLTALGFQMQFVPSRDRTQYV